MTSLILSTNAITFDGQVTKPALTSEGLTKVLKGIVAALYVGFVPMFYTYFAARALGLSALCYDDLANQAASAGLCILPFAMYCLIFAGRRSLKSVFSVSAIVSAVLGVILAAMV